LYSYLGNNSLARLYSRVELISLLVCLIFVLFPADSKAANPSSVLATTNVSPTPSSTGITGSAGYDRYQEVSLLLKKRKWAEASIVLQKVLKDNPDLTEAAVDLARALVYSGRREEALSMLLQAANREKGKRRLVLIRRTKILSRLFLTNTTFQTHQEGLNFLFVHKYRQARERFQKALEEEPDNVEILVRIGQSLVMDGDFDSAAERLKLARKLNPFEPQIRLWLGRALHQRGELSKSIDELHLAATQMLGSEVAPVWYAEALASSGQRAAALAALEEDVRAYPFHLLSLVTLARLRQMGVVLDKAGMWVVRRDLQVALSRFEKYVSPDYKVFEGELELNIRSPEKVKLEIDILLQRIESKIKTEGKEEHS